MDRPPSKRRRSKSNEAESNQSKTRGGRESRKAEQNTTSTANKDGETGGRKLEQGLRMTRRSLLND